MTYQWLAGNKASLGASNPTVAPRRYIKICPEDICHMALRGEPAPIGDFGNRHVGVCQFVTGVSQSTFDQIAMRRLTCCLLERSQKVGWAKRYYCGEIGQAQILIEAVLDELVNFFQFG